MRFTGGRHPGFFMHDGMGNRWNFKTVVQGEELRQFEEELRQLETKNEPRLRSWQDEDGNFFIGFDDEACHDGFENNNR